MQRNSEYNSFSEPITWEDMEGQGDTGAVSAFMKKRFRLR